MVPERELNYADGAIGLRIADGTLIIELSGKWKLDKSSPSSAKVQRRLESESGARLISFDSQKLEGWDSSLLTFLIGVDNQAH